MLAFVLASLVISAAAAPSPHPEPSCVTTSVGAQSAGWWSHHAHPKWRSAWNSHHAHHTSGHPHHHQHTSVSASSSAVAASSIASSAAATNSTVTSVSLSSASPASTHITSTHAATSTPVPSSSAHSSSSKPPPSSSTSAGASPTSGASLSPSAAAYLNPHNAMRAKHSAKPLTWSEDLANAAKTWANNCKWAHSGGAVGNFGENIAAGTGKFDAASAVAAWASEESQYNPANPTYSHFTQMVWKATTQVGCSVASCPGLLNSDVAQFHVCEYSVAGNVIGQFAQNVS